MELPANGTKALTVQTEQIADDTTVVSSASVDSLLVYVDNKTLSGNGLRQLQKLIALKKQLTDLDASLSSAKSQMQQLSEDENRLRDNLNSLNRVSGQQDRVSKYAQQLADEDTKIVQLRDQISDLQQRRNATNTQMQQAAEQLDF
jgi:chromosome segregation ATPase